MWNRLRYLKNPETGKRVSRMNPSSAVTVKDVPELRIVDGALWSAVKARQARTRQAADEGLVRARRPDRKSVV